ncbi:MAG: hypothetical protein R3F35_19300 [Myxococcota bacterium]
MDRESLDRLRFDRRLQNRRGWLAPGELEGYLERLPDVAEKLTTLTEEDGAAAEAGAPTAAEPSGSGAPTGQG